MISDIKTYLRDVRRLFSRSEWAIRLLGLSKLENHPENPGLVMVQIDGLGLSQFQRALQKNHLPYLNSLLQKERYVLHPMYSGLPSNTPNVQAEIFYGIKTCVPAFSFVDRKSGQAIKMNETEFVAQREAELKIEGGEGLLKGGSSYSNIFTGDAEEAHFCWSQLGWGGVLHAVNPLVFPFLIILYIDIFIRTFFLLVIEFFSAVFECIRGTIKGRLFFREFELVYLRVLVCVFLREIVVAGVCMDIMRGLPIIHLNFLGYDEQSHGRGPSSRFAHWSLEGIDNAIRRINHVINQSPLRKYDLWVYSDHGQDKTAPYLIKYGSTFEDAIKKLFGGDSNVKSAPSKNVRESSSRTRLIHGRIFGNRRKPAKIEDLKAEDIVVTAMGPLGHIYFKKELMEKDIVSIAEKLVQELKVPLVLRPIDKEKVWAWTPHGQFVLPDNIQEVFGADHPFLDEMKEDILKVCFHPDAGEFIILGWCKGEEPISFPLEYGAHAGASVEETKAFALLPIDTPLEPQKKPYLRPLDLRKAAQNFLNQSSFFNFYQPLEPAVVKPLRIMTYNVHGCRGLDGAISTARIARVIARYHPDVVCLQELDVCRSRSACVDQCERIAQRLEMTYHFHSTFRYKDEQYGNAILSRYPMALIKQEALPAKSNKKIYEPRGAIWVAIEYLGIKIQIINTHLSLWPQEQALQLNTLLGKEWIEHPDCNGPIILCGDFNLTPRSSFYKRICSHFKDSQSLLAGHRPHHTWFSEYPYRRIDYIFVTAEFQVKRIETSYTVLEKKASDHLPLVVQFGLDSFGK